MAGLVHAALIAETGHDAAVYFHRRRAEVMPVLKQKFESSLKRRFDAAQVARARRWDMREVRRFMIVFGLVSSAFDLLTFALLHGVFRAGEALFQTAWLMRSSSTRATSCVEGGTSVTTRTRALV